jgi:MazG family protein
MPLLVVPIDPEEVGALTIEEWDALVSCERVLFERPGHPLAARLAAHGVDAGPFDDELDAGRDGWAVVLDASSPRAVELAKAGARVMSGAARSPDSLTSAHGARVARRAAAALGGAALVMARLRSPDGCPWDHEQTHESLEVHLIEEAHEVLDAIDRGATGAELEEELGDLLLQVLFHAQMAADDERFDIEGVANVLAGKLVHRHPHVFGDVAVTGASDVVRNWEAIKAAEKQRTGPFDDVPSSLPALLAAYKIQKRAAGLDWAAPGPEAIARLEQAVAAVSPSPSAAELGEVLFWTVAVARAAGLDPESALRQSTLHFKETF